MATPTLERLVRLSIMTSIWYNKSPSFCRKLNSLCVLCTNMQLMLLHCFDVVGLVVYLTLNRKEPFFGNNHKQEGVNRLENLFFPPF